MDLSLLLESLLKRVDGVLKVAFLVFVLLLDIRVDFYILDFLVFDVWVEIFIDSSLQLIEIINELNSSVDSIGEAFYEDVISSYLASILFN